jgi:hypothetical protein
MVNANGIKSVYVGEISYEAPSPRKGMKIVIRLHEWFEEEKEAKGAKKGSPTAYQRPDYFGDPNALANRLQQNAGMPADPDTIMANSMDGDPPPRTLLPGDEGWHGFKTNKAPPPPPPKRDFTGFGPNRPFG